MEKDSTSISLRGEEIRQDQLMNEWCKTYEFKNNEEKKSHKSLSLPSINKAKVNAPSSALSLFDLFHYLERSWFGLEYLVCHLYLVFHLPLLRTKSSIAESLINSIFIRGNLNLSLHILQNHDTTCSLDLWLVTRQVSDDNE